MAVPKRKKSAMRSKNIKFNLFKNKLNLMLFKWSFLKNKKFKKLNFSSNITNLFNN